jgi:hypothetical protein
LSATQSIRGAAPLQFVNHLGYRVSVSAPAAQEPAKPAEGGVAAKRAPKESRGFEIVGIKAKRLQAAEKRAAARRVRWEQRGPKSKAKEPLPWCAESWLSEQQPERAMRETFAVESAAQMAAEMLKKQGGWLRVSVLPRAEA